MNLPGFGFDYQSMWQGSRDAQQGQINTGSNMWAQLIAQQQQAAAANNARWRGLLGNTLRGLRGANRSNLQDISDKYSAMSGAMSQQMIDRGLGNTTVQQSAQLGIAGQRARAATDSRNKFAQTIAGYKERIGGAGLQAEMQNNSMLAGLGKGQIDWLTGINIGYPERAQYEGGGGGGMFAGGGAPGLGYGGSGNQMHQFASDAMPMGYESGGGYGGGYQGWSNGYGGATWNAAPSGGGEASGGGVNYTDLGLGAQAYSGYSGGGDF